MFDELGDRMKLYENKFSGERLIPLLPAFARIDGRSFHRFTVGLDRPFDERLHNLMVFTTKFLVSETNALVGYTQSDEITLGWYSSNIKSQLFFDGRIQKMVSQLAALATNWFNRTLEDYLPHSYWLKFPTFDARVWNVPTLEEASNVFVWRENDCRRNSVLMAGASQFSHNELLGKSCNEIQEMLFQRSGINWNNYPDWAKNGTYVFRKKRLRKFSSEELDRLPKGHEARRNPELTVERTEFITKSIRNLASYSVEDRISLLFDITKEI